MKEETYKLINKDPEMPLNEILETLYQNINEVLHDNKLKNFFYNKTFGRIETDETLKEFCMAISVSGETEELIDNIYIKLLQTINDFKNIESSKNSFYYFGELYDSNFENDHLFFANIKFKTETHHILLINHLFDEFNYEEIKTPSLITMINKIKEENPFIYNFYIKKDLEKIVKNQNKEKLRKYRNKILAHQEIENDTFNKTIEEIEDLYSEDFLNYYSSILKIITEIRNIIKNAQFENDDFFEERHSSIDELKNDYDYYKEIYIEDIFQKIKTKSNFYITISY